MAQHLVGLIYMTETGELLRMVEPGDDAELRYAEFCNPGETFSVMQSEGAPTIRDAIDYLAETTGVDAESICPAPMRSWLFPKPEDPAAGV